MNTTDDWQRVKPNALLGDPAAHKLRRSLPCPCPVSLLSSLLPCQCPTYHGISIFCCWFDFRNDKIVKWRPQVTASAEPHWHLACQWCRGSPCDDGNSTFCVMGSVACENCHTVIVVWWLSWKRGQMLRFPAQIYGEIFPIYRAFL